MGVKGDKLTNASVLAAEALVEQLNDIGSISSKKMFGGHGIFHEGKMFGIVDSKGQCYLKADKANKAEYEAAGSHQHSRMPYFSIPDAVLENREELLNWAKRSIDISK
ncbi:transcriptional regulator [Leptobacterium flavescens]|uniref:Transcriptional regulator n=1 Tax=Leptobacterium flavescens TaxID=472055 RepID=A0A6P0UQD5_9FLAO|nr:TfoX/Sxy family protein [Leptobacterium flavescens]NER14722.1 transcriptional regulator [Leptobacterium flavescens]